jgi:hypothetical protein
LIVLVASGEKFAPSKLPIPELNNGDSIWETGEREDSSAPGGAIPQKGKAGTIVPASPSGRISVSLKA